MITEVQCFFMQNNAFREKESSDRVHIEGTTLVRTTGGKDMGMLISDYYKMSKQYGLHKEESKYNSGVHH